MAIETWIDTITDLAGTVSDGKLGFVLSYPVYRTAKMPESMSAFPCAITYVENLTPIYSLGGPSIDLWSGVTEFHLFPNTAMANYPEAMRYFARIKAAFAGNMTLSSKVSYFQLKPDESGLALTIFNPDTDAAHLGIIARWICKENTTGDFTVST